MPKLKLTPEERLERKRASAARYRAKHREKIRAYLRRHHAEHREALNAASALRYAKNRVKRRAVQQAHVAHNRDRINARRNERNAQRRKDPAYVEKQRLYNIAHRARTREHRLARHYQWRQEHPEQYHAQDARFRSKYAHALLIKRQARSLETNARVRAARKANPEAFRARDARGHARLKGATVLDFDDKAQWKEIQAAFDHRCAYCGKRAKGKLTRDHITAVTKDGTHTLHNIVPACRSCNSKKGAGEPLVPVQPLLLTLAPARKPKKRKAS